MPTDKDILLFQVDDAIETMQFQIRQQCGDSPVQAAIKDALTAIEIAVSRLPDNDPCLVDLFQKKELLKEYDDVYGMSLESQKYLNLRRALSYKDSGKLDKYETEDAIELIEEIKDSDNYYDKLAVGIIASLLGGEYAPLKEPMITEYLQSGSSTILISNDDVKEML